MAGGDRSIDPPVQKPPDTKRGVSVSQRERGREREERKSEEKRKREKERERKRGKKRGIESWKNIETKAMKKNY